jgi:K(+)-stimulated pyrophosphate-energized sodium pump
VDNIHSEVQKDFGFKPDFENAKHQLEKGDGAGNTFKATAKPVLIGTAVVGATTMVFGIILLLEKLFGQVERQLSLVQPEVMMGLLMGGSVIYWFTGASTQAVVTGAYRAVVFIKNNIRLDSGAASIEDSKEVVKICTIYAQKGMINIFVVIFCMSLALPFFNPYFFIDRDRFLWFVPGNFYGERRRSVGQRQEDRRSRFTSKKYAAARRYSRG